MGTKMRILFCGYTDSPLIDFLRQLGNSVDVTSKPISGLVEHDWIISYGYRHLFGEAIIDHMAGKMINLHISYLPWNKGADPVFWSIIEGTPAGVTIHRIDQGIDTGPVVARERVEGCGNQTVQSYIELHHREIQSLFKEVWPIMETLVPIPQVAMGSYHRTRDKEYYTGEIPNWKSLTIDELLEHAGEIEASAECWEFYRREM